MNLHDHLFSVSELNNVIKSVLEESFYSINIEGELSNFRPSSTGHWYFSLKDNDSTISAVLFKNMTYSVNFKPKDGLKVKIKGKLSLYSQRGTYQIICNELELFGEGDILLVLEERKRRFASLGYFDPSKKKILPRFPENIGIITSPTSAALQDILKVLKRRHSMSNIIVLPSVVQGSEASNSIVRQINYANERSLCDLIIISRGGGSTEDLLPFSDEKMVLSICNSKIPVITGIGHEIDTTLSDLAADIRAATPSAAAEIVTESSEKLYEHILNLKNSLYNIINLKLSIIRNKISIFDKKSVNKLLYSKIENRALHIDSLKRSIISETEWKLERFRNKTEEMHRILNELSPFKLFEKGYSWVTKDDISIQDSEISCNDMIKVIYSRGIIKAKVEEITDEI